jgi:hypothetical protein
VPIKKPDGTRLGGAGQIRERRSREKAEALARESLPLPHRAYEAELGSETPSNATDGQRYALKAVLFALRQAACDPAILEEARRRAEIAKLAETVSRLAPRADYEARLAEIERRMGVSGAKASDEHDAERPTASASAALRAI